MVTRAAFTLPEVIVAMLLLSIGGLGVAATGLVAVQAFTRAELQDRALAEAQNLLDSLLALPAHTAGARVLPHARVTWTGADTLGRVVVTVSMQNQEPLELTGQR